MTAGVEASTERSIRTVVNGGPVEATVPVRLSLADWLRDGLGLTGTHLGCEQGVCGACTVMVDGEPARSCLMFAVQADGCSVLTIEGLGGDGGAAAAGCLHHLQEAFAEHHGLQCGFCTPGMILASLGYLAEPGPHSRAGLRRYLSGNICRCTGYMKILEAVEAAARQMGVPWSS
jgi:aerobic carbon-monoxide dehydrogenase small subunit